MSDVLVIGAGASGMSCALALAKAGRSVRIIEKAHRTAPVIRGFKRRGLHFDCGFHYAGSLGRGELFAQILDYLDVYPKLECIPLEPEGTDIIRIEEPSVQVPIPHGWERLEESLCRRFPSDTTGIIRFLSMVRDAFEDIPKQFAGINDFGVNGLLDDGLGPSLKEVLDDLIQDPVLKTVLAAQSFLYGTKPEETPFIVHARVIGTHYQSLYTVRGGGSAIADAFDATMADSGIDVTLSAEAESLVLDADGRITALMLADGSELTANEYVFSGHPWSLVDLLPDALRLGRMGKRIRRLQDTFSAHILFCETDSVPNCLNMRNALVHHDLEHDILRDDVPVSKRGFFASFCQPSGDGRHTFTAIFPESHSVVAPWSSSRYGHRDAEYDRFKSEATTCFMERLQSGLPELKNKVRAVCSATPLTIKHYCSTPETAGIYGVKHRCGQVPVLPKTRIPNLFQCGQAVITPGLFGAVYSGLITTAVMTGGDQLIKDLFQ
jgi:all-trans-retinol 13,14-reductase